MTKWQYFDRMALFTDSNGVSCGTIAAHLVFQGPCVPAHPDGVFTYD